MNLYVYFIIKKFFISFIFIYIVVACLAFVLNLITELEFFKDIDINNHLPVYLSLLDTPIMVFETFPFLFFISTQLFFNNLLENNELNIFKYSGLKNFSIIKIISITTLILSLIIITLYYNFSSNLKNLYLSLKKDYTDDGKYLAVITKNGLWIRDIVDENKIIVNAEKIELNYIINSNISIFDKNFDVLKNIRSSKIDISKKKWILYDSIMLEANSESFESKLNLQTNYDYNIIQNLFSNLSSLSLKELLILRENYNQLGFSLIEIDIHLLKICLYPFYLIIMVVLSASIMLNSKRFKYFTVKFSLGLFISVTVYYLNNFFLTLGKTEQINLFISILSPIIILGLLTFFMLRNINEK